jgi:peptidoglycan/LPS O-acetylase OafA/YrhL
MKFRKDIEGLRALAILLVIFDHLHIPYFSGGYVGVDVFFVISGFLITGLIASEYHKNASENNGLGRISLRAFYFRRVKRIYPMVITVILVVVVSGYQLYNSARAGNILNDGIWAAFFGANIHFISQATDYFQQGAGTSPLQHFWSLAVEEQFYLIFPALFIFSAKRHGLSIRGRRITWAGRIAAVVIIITTASFTFSVIQSYSNPQSAYFSSLTRAWELGVGALLALASYYQRRHSFLKLSPLSLQILGISLIAAATMFLTSASAFPGYLALLPVCGTTLFLLARPALTEDSAATGNVQGVSQQLEPTNWIERFFSSTPVRYIGRISFSLYLWHWPVLIFLTDQRPGWMASRFARPMALIVTLGLAMFSYKYIETPTRKIAIPQSFLINSPRLTRPQQRVSPKEAALVLFTVVVLAAASAVYFTKPSPIKNSNHYSLSALSEELPIANENSTQAVAKNSSGYASLLNNWQRKIIQGESITKVPANLDPPLNQLETKSIYWNSCFAQSLTVACQFGDPAASKTVVVMGDSYAISILPMVLGALPGWKVVALTSRQCMIADVTPIFGSPNAKPDSKCPEYRHWALDYLKKNMPDLLIISDDSDTPILGRNGETINSPGDAGSPIWTSALKQTLLSINLLKIPFLYVGTPPLSGSLISCVDNFQHLTSSCNGTPRSRSTSRFYERKFTEEFGGIFLDLQSWMCANFACPAIIDKTPVTFDGSHLSQNFAVKMAPLFKSYLKTNSLS